MSGSVSIAAINTQGPRYLSATGASLSISREVTLFIAYLTRTIVRVIVLSPATRRYTYVPFGK